MKIVAIGGGEIGRPKDSGGFYPIETTEIDKRILELTGKKNPKLLFIPTASYDSVDYFEVVKSYFLNLGCGKVDVLYIEDARAPKKLEKKILSSDAIYVGGGNTLRMMKIWRKFGIDKMLKKAASNDIVLSGLSAGSICWFSCGNSDSWKFSSGSEKLIKVSGLGLIDALHCPHYNTELFRQKDLKKMMKNTPRLVAIALDDCTALEVVNGKYRILKSKKNAKARKTYWKNNKYIIEEIENNNYMDLNELLQKR